VRSLVLPAAVCERSVVVRALILLVLIVMPVAALVGTRLCGLIRGPGYFRLRSLSLVELFEVQDRERVRKERLTERGEAMLHSLNVKQDVAAKVAEGRMDLFTAAAAFRQVQAGIPHYNLEAFRNAYPADTDEERYCLAVISYVREHLEDSPTHSPARRAELVGALRAELQSRKLRGPLRLPGPLPARNPQPSLE
jgi:hypothetical protein